MFAPRRIAITGANGFLGRNSIKSAVKRGIAVNAIVRRESAAEIVGNLGARPIIIKDFEKNELNRAFADCYGVIHFAGIVREEGNDTYENVNVHGTEAIVSAAKIANVRRLIVPSGLGVDEYGKKDWATNEYFLSKQRVEEIVRGSTVPYVIFRPSFILGPGDELIPSLVKQVRRGLVRIAGAGITPMQPVYVVDASSIFVSAAMGLGPENVILDLVGPLIVNMLNVIDLVAQSLKQMGVESPELRIIHVPLNAAPRAFGLSKEEVCVMQCDKVGDVKQVPRAFDIALSPPIEAVEAAVKAALALEVVEK